MPPASGGIPYAELQVTTNYFFLRDASHVEELLLMAKALGLAALAITDRNTLAGIARAHARAAEAGVRLVVGCRLDLRDSPPVLAYPLDRAGYSRLCRLLTLGKGRAGKGGCDLAWADLVRHGDGLLLVLLPDQPDAGLTAALARLRDGFPGRGYLSLCLRRRPGDAARLHELASMGQAARVPAVVTGDVLYHTPQRRILQDVVTCIREGCIIDDVSFRRERHTDRHLKAPAEMARLYARHPDALARTLEIVGRCTFSLSELRYQYPDEAERPGEAPQAALERLVWQAVPSRYPASLPPKVDDQLRHELRLIGELEYAPYFLTVHSIVRFARSRGILCQGRGSAANSAVCFVLGITSIDPVRSGLLFERFVSVERREPPDIDVDFEAERREEVIQWVYEHYGRDRAALCCTVMRFRPRGAIRDVGKVLGLTEDVTGALASQVWGGSDDDAPRGGGGSNDGSAQHDGAAPVPDGNAAGQTAGGRSTGKGVTEEHARTLGLNLQDRRLRLALQLAEELVGFPRQLGTHPGGFVLTSGPLSDLVPGEPAAMAGRQVIEWDKDDIDALKWMKVDVLGLGMLGCLRRGFELIEQAGGAALDIGGRPPMDIATIPPEDPATYAMIRRADTVLPLFAAADAGGRPRPEIVEAPIELAPMRDGREVVEDYGSTGLSLRRHPVAFLRDDLRRRGMVACANLLHLRDGRRVVVPGLVLVRQKPGSAKSVMFITIEDETGVANLVLWPDRYAAQRSLVLSASMLSCHGRVQREGEVVHVIADRLEDLSELLRSVGERDAAACLAGSDQWREAVTRLAASMGMDVPKPPSQSGAGIRVPTRDFR